MPFRRSCGINLSTPKDKRIESLVCGVSGAIGKVIARDLIRGGMVSDIEIVDQREETLARVKDRIGSDKSGYREGDVPDRKLAENEQEKNVRNGLSWR